MAALDYARAAAGHTPDPATEVAHEIAASTSSRVDRHPRKLVFAESCFAPLPGLPE
jgi:hypothetical protein